MEPALDVLARGRRKKEPLMRSRRTKKNSKQAERPAWEEDVLGAENKNKKSRTRNAQTLFF